MRVQSRQTSSRAGYVVVALVFCIWMGAASECLAGKFPAANSREANAIRNQIRAAQFLSHATFGPTQKMIDDLAGRIGQVGYHRACEEWIDQQFALPATSHVEVARKIYTADGRQEDTQDVGMQLYRYQAWWHIALTSEDQLRQRVAWALSQIFVISDSGTDFNNDDRRSKGNGEMTITDWVGMSDYYDMLARHTTGNYRELLGDVTFHPCMGVYLSSWRNQKANISAGRFPDENYAREIMQLFSIGLYKLKQDGRLEVDSQGNLIPTYDNDGITELARLFTGFRSFHNNSTSFTTGTNFGDPMEMYFQEHDNNRNYREHPTQPGTPDPNAPVGKTLFGVTLSPLPVPLTNEGALAEVNEGLDVIANHNNVPPFISRLLIQRLVKSNPSRAYLRRVTRVFRDNGQGQRGDLNAVVKAILLDPEAVQGQRLVRRQNPLAVEVVTRGTESSRLREPVLRITSLLRALKPRSVYPSGTANSSLGKIDPATGQPFMMLSNSIEGDLGQLPFDAPSVFNYYLPDYQPPGDLVSYVPSGQIPREALFAPEFQILTAVTANRMVNRLTSIARNRNLSTTMRVGSCRIDLDLSEELELAKNTANLPEILRRFDLLLCNGSLSEQSKTHIINAITSENLSNTDRLQETLLAVLISPDCAVEE